MPNEIHQIAQIFAIMDGKSIAQADVERIIAKKPRTNRVKRARPTEPLYHRASLCAEYLCGDALDPTLHFGGSATGKGEQQNAARVSA